MSGTGLEVAFELLSLFEGFEGDVESQFPGRVLLDVVA